MAKARRVPEGYAEPLSQRMLRHPILDKDRERALLRRAAAGDDGARNALVASNVRFVLSFARRYGPMSGLEIEDAVQEGAIGEIRAIRKFDVGKGFRLSTYASWWVRQAIQRAGQETGRTVKLPAPVLADIRRIDAARTSIEAAGGEPTEDALMEATGFGLQRLRDIAAAAAALTTSLDAPITEDGRTLADFCGDPSTGPATTYEHVERQERQLAVREALSTLKPLERAVIKARFEDDLTLEAAAAVVAPLCAGGRTVSRERIRQIEMRALGKLRLAMTATGTD